MQRIVLCKDKDLQAQRGPVALSGRTLAVTCGAGAPHLLAIRGLLRLQLLPVLLRLLLRAHRAAGACCCSGLCCGAVAGP